MNKILFMFFREFKELINFKSKSEKNLACIEQYAPNYFVKEILLSQGCRDLLFMKTVNTSNNTFDFLCS